MKKVIIASNNAHKVSEIQGALDFKGWEFMTLKEAGITSEPDEDASTFEGNARIKAKAAYEASGLAVLADDSGIVVDALDGCPGVYSARYAGENASDIENNTKLLSELEGVSREERTGRFVCSMVFIDEDGTELIAEGTIEGVIGYEPIGTEGFGYDPLFLPLVFAGEKTLAQISQVEKSQISHRGNALRALKEKIQRLHH